MISHNFRCIFVHIPKTAGNSINRVFGVEWQDHKDLARYAAEQPPEIFQGYFKFAIVRNPWDRLFSDYNYQRKKSRARDSKLFLFNEQGRQRSFAAWVELALSQAASYAPQQWGGEVSPDIHRWSPQLDWITVDGKPAVDFVARLENLATDFPLVCQRVGIAANRLPRRNRRLHWHYSHYYDRNTREVVAAYYAQDIEAFGYDFEDRTFRVRIFPLISRLAPPPGASDGSRSGFDQEEADAVANRGRNSCSAGGFSQRRRPPSLRRQLTAVFAAGLIATAGWLGSGFVGSAAEPEDGAPPPEQSVPLHRMFAFLHARAVPPAGAEGTASLSKLQTASIMFASVVPLPAFVFPSDTAKVNAAAARPAFAARRFSSPPPTFAMQHHWHWFQRFDRGR